MYCKDFRQRYGAKMPKRRLLEDFKQALRSRTTDVTSVIFKIAAAAAEGNDKNDNRLNRTRR